MITNIVRLFFAKKASKVFMRSLFSYLIVLSIPLIVIGIIYYQVNNIMEKEVREASNIVLKQLSQTIDSNLKEVEQLATQISLSPRIKDFMYATAPLNFVERYQMVQVIKDLSSYKSGSKFVNDLYVYFSDSDIILTPTAKFDPSTFYRVVYRYPDIDYQQWVNDILHGQYYKQYLSYNAVSADTMSNEMITYIQTAPVWEKGNSYINIVLLIQRRELEDLLNNNANDRGWIYIVDQNNHVVASTSGAIDLPSSIYDKIKDPYGSFNETIGSDNMIVSYLSSNQNQWKFVALIPRSVLMAEVKHVRATVLYTIVLCFLIGVIASYLMAYKNYNPVKKLVNIITARLGQRAPSHVDEYDFIHKVMVSTLDTEEELKHRLHEHVPTLKTEFVRNLLKGNIISPSTIDSLKLYGVDFSGNRFIVLLFHIDDVGSLKGDDLERKWDVIHFTITSVSERLMSRYGSTYMADLEKDTMAMIICCKEGIQETDLKRGIHIAAKEAQEFVRKELDVRFSVSVGEICSDMANVKDSYQQAVRAMDYRMVKGYNAIICYSDISALNNQDYYYPIELEMQLINHVKAGNEEHALALLERVFKENFVHRDLSITLIKCLFFDMMSTAIKTVNEIKLDYNSAFGSSFDLITRLLHCETVEQMYAELKDIYNNICARVKQKQKSHNDALRNRILDFIDQNYTDKNMCLSFIADSLGITPAYLSHFFKEQVGYNISDHLNMIRIAHAKRMLKDKELSLASVAKEVGYNNDVALIRAFKKYEGITPGQYRDSIISSTR